MTADIRKQENELIQKAVWWAIHSAEQINAAGGNPAYVLKNLDQYTIQTLVRNDLVFLYLKEAKRD